MHPNRGLVFKFKPDRERHQDGAQYEQRRHHGTIAGVVFAQHQAADAAFVDYLEPALKQSTASAPWATALEAELDGFADGADRIRGVWGGQWPVLNFVTLLEYTFFKCALKTSRI